MRRAITATSARQTVGCLVALPPLATQMRALHAPLSTVPLGQGKIVKLKFDQPKPAYIPMDLMKTYWIFFWWVQQSLIAGVVVCTLLVFSAHGGFLGYLPPDPRTQWN